MSAPVLTGRRVAKTCLLLAVLLVFLSLISLSVGAAATPLPSVASAFWDALSGSPETLTSRILFDVRLPRILLAMIVGAGLAVAGAGYQALLRNPLADPYVLGVSSGAALGTILALLLPAPLALLKPLAAFAGATATIAVVYFLGRRSDELSPYLLLLAGVITASFLSAVITFLLTFLSGRDLRGAAFWLMGDLSNPPALDWLWLAVAGLIALSLGVIYFVANDLNLLLSGEPEAQSLGADIQRTKLIVYLAASLATGLAVSVSGAIGYVGLLVPHLVRLLFGGDYRLLVPASALGGAIMLVAADTLARTLVAPTELPVGAVTAVVGAPVFIYLLRTRLGARAGGGAE